MVKRKKKVGLPPVKKYRLLEAGIEEGLRGFLLNDMEPSIPEEKVEWLVDSAVGRVLLALGERFQL